MKHAVDVLQQCPQLGHIVDISPREQYGRLQRILAARAQIIYDADLVPAVRQPIRQRSPNKTSAARDQKSHHSLPTPVNGWYYNQHDRVGNTVLPWHRWPAVNDMDKKTDG